MKKPICFGPILAILERFSTIWRANAAIHERSLSRPQLVGNEYEARLCHLQPSVGDAAAERAAHDAELASHITCIDKRSRRTYRSPRASGLLSIFTQFPRDLLSLPQLGDTTPKAARLTAVRRLALQEKISDVTRASALLSVA